MELLLIFAPVLAGLLFTTLNDDDDVEPVNEPDVDPEAEPGTDIVSGRFNDLSSADDDVTIDNPEFYGSIRGGDGNDTMTVQDSAERPTNSGIQYHNDRGYPLYTGTFPENGENYDFGTRRYFEYSPEFYATDEDGNSSVHDASFEYSSDTDGTYGPQDAFADGIYPLNFLTEIHGGEGDDLIRLDGGDFFVDPGVGADTIEVSSGDGDYWLGDGDSLIVTSEDASVSAKINGVGSEGILFDGSMANASSDNSVQVNGASTLIGGDGGDWFKADGEGSDVTGGDGDDTIHLNPDIFAANTASTYFSDYSGISSSTAEGGRGDDDIIFDHGDTVTGGEGNDTLTGYLEPGATAHITDFKQGEDIATIWVETSSHDSSYDTDVYGIPEGMSVAEIDGNTEISQDGEVIARFEGATGLTVGRAVLFNEEDYILEYVDQNGNAIDPNQADIMISEFVAYP